MNGVIRNGVEVSVTLLQGSDGRWRWAVVVDRPGSDDAPDIVDFYANVCDARSAAWRTAQQLGGKLVYPEKQSSRRS